jgi:hypothetical protein
MIYCNLNPEHESTDLKWRVSVDGVIHLVKEVIWITPCRTQFNPDWGKQGGFCVACSGRFTLSDGIAIIVEGDAGP